MPQEGDEKETRQMHTLVNSAIFAALRSHAITSITTSSVGGRRTQTHTCEPVVHAQMSEVADTAQA